MVAPIVLGALADHYGFQSAFFVSGILMLLTVLVATKLPETRSSHLGQP
jgi:dipeptide/tripeptide permease